MKGLTLLCFAILCAVNVQSQEFNAGIYGGGVASQLDGDTYDGFGKAGLTIGAYVNRNIKEKWAWQMGLRYVQKGSKRVDDELGVYYKSQLHYVEMPFTIRYQHFKKIDFEGGISFGYLVKALEDKDAYGLIEADPPFKNYEAATIFGINYHFSEKTVLSIHHSYSLLPVRPHFKGFESFIDGGQYNNLLFFTLTYKLSNWQ